jgi:predicted O-linked N-acetylglucosamine transferase (SPINDLY family)
MNQAIDLCRQASDLLAKGEIPAAIRLCQQAIAIQPNLLQAYEILATLQPENAQLKFSLGGLLLQQGQLGKAEGLFRSVVQIDPKNVLAYCGLGIVLAKQNRHAEAIPCFESALQIQPQNFDALFNLGIALLQQNRILEAVSTFVTAKGVKPQDIRPICSLGLALERQGKIDEAIAAYQEAIALQPTHFPAYIDLINTLARAKRFNEAIAPLEAALKLQPHNAQLKCRLGRIFSDRDEFERASEIFLSVLNVDQNQIEAHCGMGIVLIKRDNLAEAIQHLETALQIEPQHFDSLLYLGIALTSQNQLDEALAKFQIAYKINPNDAELNYRIGFAFMKANQRGSAINHLQRSLNIEPKVVAYSKLVECLCALVHSRDHFHANEKVGELLQETIEKYGRVYTGRDFLQASIASISACLNSGCNEALLKSKLIELENYIYSRVEPLTSIEVDALYCSALFAMFSIRDDRDANSKFAKLVGAFYTDLIIKPKLEAIAIAPKPSNRTLAAETTDRQPLRIGILNGHMYRNAASWCSIDAIEALSHITPHIYLYASKGESSDDITQRFEQIAAGVCILPSTDWTSTNLANISQQISQDRIDVLLDLDSITDPKHVALLYGNPSPVCISWLGFDAPYTSPHNYFLGDRYTHPEGVDACYVEQMIRLPHAHMAVAGFTCNPINRDEARQALGVSPDQIAYLYNCHVRKLNYDSIQSQVKILKHVPNSVLLRKGYGNHAGVRQIYAQECDRYCISRDRVIFMPLVYSEEDHRTAYLLADVCLDSYPYNGGSQNLEALWFNLPVVTLVGEQSFARMGYSFLQTLGIEAGIAYNWEEYVEWGIKFGLDRELRQSVRSHLVQSKQSETLSPLWNPSQLARDMYAIFEKLLAVNHP